MKKLNLTQTSYPNILPKHLKLLGFLLLVLLPDFSYAQDISCPYPVNESTLCNEKFKPDFEITSATTSESLIPLYGNPPVWNSYDVYINATLTVKTTFSMYNCNIKMGPNGRIIVTDGGHFICSTNQFFGCNLWPGITVEGTGELDFFLNHIEDAEKAIEITSDNAILSVAFNVFNRNVVGIYVDQAAPNALIAANLFDCTSDTYAGAPSEAGIRLNKAMLTIGVPTAISPFSRNDFRYQKIGIDCQSSSTLQSYYADFRCCFEFGVKADEGTTYIQETQNPGGGYYKNSFIHNLTDIFASGTNLDVRYSYFDGCLTDNILALDNNAAQLISITHDSIVITGNNTATPTKSGIVVERSSGTSFPGIHNNIEDNLIRILPFASANRRHGIRVEGFPGTGDGMLIQRNTITVGRGGSFPSAANNFTSTFLDVNLRSSGGYQVLRNAILVQNEENIFYSNRWGFHLHGWESPSAGNYLLENHVLGTYNEFDFGCCAYHFNESGPWNMCFNESNYTLRGFHMNNFCGGSLFARNYIGDHHTSPIVNPSSFTAGLLMEENSQIGIQVCRQNQWTIPNYSPNRGAWHKDNATGVAFSRFDVDPLQVGTVPNPILPVINWFVLIPSGCSSGGPEECYTSSGYKDSLDKYEQKILENGMGFSAEETSPAGQWEQHRQLLGKLLTYPALIESYPEAQAFFGQHIEQSAGQFAQFNQTLHESLLLPEDMANILHESQMTVQAALNALREYDSAIQDSAQFVSAGADFFAGRQSVLQQIKEATVQQNDVLDQVNTWRNTMLENCLQMQQALPSGEVYEQNQKFIHGLEIKKALGQSFTDTDYEMLRAIAQQCPWEAGLTIDRAKGMLPNNDPLASWSDNPDEGPCQQATEERSGEQISTPILVSLLPNPANETLSIRFSIPFSGDITVFAPSGIAVLSQNGYRDQTETNLQIEKLPAGVYSLLTRTISGNRQITRFTVVK